jgi:probable HAF family extracellular repeat protein
MVYVRSINLLLYRSNHSFLCCLKATVSRMEFLSVNSSFQTKGTRVTHLILMVVFLLTFGHWLAEADAPTQYTITPLCRAAPRVAQRRPGTTERCLAQALDDAGTVVGAVQVGARFVAAILAPTPQQLGRLDPDGNSTARGVDGDVIVGDATTADGLNHGFAWTAGTGMVDINGGALLSIAHAVRQPAPGVVFAAGSCVFAASVGARPCFWTNSVPTERATPSGLAGDSATLNADGVLAGSYTPVAGQPAHAFIVDVRGAGQDLHPPGASVSLAVALNLARVTLITAQLPTGTQVFRHDPGTGTSVALPLLAGFIRQEARDINRGGLMLTTAWAPGGQGAGDEPQRAVRCPDATTCDDLSPLIVVEPGQAWVLYNAVAVNNGGQILAYGTRNEREDWAVLLTPVPPPGEAEPKLKKMKWWKSGSKSQSASSE